MGKRELFIALAFTVVGAIAYHVTAPAPNPAEQGFSFSRFWNEARREIRGNQAQASHTSSGTFPVSRELTDVRFEGTFAELKLIGEARADVTYALTAQSNGPDPETALDYAKRVALKSDDLGRSLTLRISYPREARQSAAVIVRIPSRLGVLVASSSGLQASGIASAHLDNVSGDVTLSGIAGALSGLHRNGRIDVRGAGSVKLTLQRSRASLDGVAEAVTLDLRDGECRLSGTHGPIEIDQTRAEVTIANPEGPVRIRGTEGRVTLVNPHAESKVDVRRAELEVRMSQAVPLTLLTSDDTLRLVLDGPPRIAVDAVANAGRVLAPDFDLTPEATDQESRLTHAFGGAGGARVSLRNSRGDIVIKNLRGAVVNPNRK